MNNSYNSYLAIISIDWLIFDNWMLTNNLSHSILIVLYQYKNQLTSTKTTLEYYVRAFVINLKF